MSNGVLGGKPLPKREEQRDQPKNMTLGYRRYRSG